MWDAKRIEITNLFAHKQSEYTFKNGTCTVIFGKNESDMGLDNNGSGKSTLFEGIGIALTGESLRNLSKEDFINYDEQTCKVVFELENKFSNQTLKIVREFYLNKTTRVEVWENGKINNKIVSTNEANKRIFELIGITKEDLLRYYIIDQDSKYSFFTANDVDKKDIMNRITSADMINPLIEELQKRFKENKAFTDANNSEIDKLTTRREVIEEQKEELLKEDTTADEIAIQNSKRKEKVEELSVLKKEKLRVDNLFLSKNKELSGKKFDSKVGESLDKKSSELVKNLADAVKIIRTLKNEIEEIITCPHCSKDFILNSEYNLGINESKKLLKQTEKLKEGIESDIYNNTVKKLAFDEKEEEVNALEVEIRNVQRSEKRISGDIEDVNISIEKIDKKIEELKQSKRDNKALFAFNEKIKSINKELEPFVERGKELDTESQMISFWQFNMGKSGFLTYLANKSIKIIEGITNSFLKKFKVDITILINGFKINKDGSVREKIDVFIQHDGITARKFLGKSGGERGRVQIAGILGIQHLMNLSTNGNGLNLLLLDEVFPGVDPMGQENIIKILEKMGITILMITQTVSEGFNNENTLYVKKTDGVSFYTELPKLVK